MTAKAAPAQLEIVGRRRLPIGRYAAWLVLGVTIFIMLFPLWWVLRTALSTQREIFANPKSLLPVGFTLNNFARALGMVSSSDAVAAGGSGEKLQFWLYLRNSTIVTGLLVSGQLFFCSLAAYSFARLNFPLREKVFFLYLSALMVPGIVTLIPNFLLVRRLGLLNTFAGIVAPGFLISPFAVFFLRQFFLGINKEIEEAAKIDGSSLFGIFIRIVLPMSSPPLATLAILTTIATWNDFLWPFLVGQDPNVRVLTVALAVFRSQTPQGAPDWGGLMAGTVLTIIPTLIMFMIVGRKAIDSIQFSGIK